MRKSDVIRETPWAAVWSLGNTPLVRLRRLKPHPGVEIHAKLESKNPGGTVKDRAAASMILDGLRTGALRPGRTLLDATSAIRGSRTPCSARRSDIPSSSASRQRHRGAKAPAPRLRGRSCGPAPWRDPTERCAWRSGLRRGPGHLLLPGSVQQSGQLARALRDDRPRAPRTNGRGDRPLRRRAGHERDLQVKAAARGATRHPG